MRAKESVAHSKRVHLQAADKSFRNQKRFSKAVKLYSERGAGARSLLDGSERFDQGYVLGITDNVKDGDAYLELINCPNF